MKCKSCSSCRKGYFESKPDKYVCIGVKEPFIIKDINNECTEYFAKKEVKMPMVNKKSWDEFRDSGFLWWINMILHTFGWAIVYEFDKEKNVSEVYPARVKYRGFPEEINTIGYTNVSRYMNENANVLLEEAND